MGGWIGSAAGSTIIILAALLLAHRAVVRSREEPGVRETYTKPSTVRGPQVPGGHDPRQKKDGAHKDDDGSGDKREQPPPIVKHECPYIIDSEEEVMSRIEDTSLPGNVVTVEDVAFGRTGNHFVSCSHNLSIGYCCKSKVVWLPEKDDILAPGIFNKGTPGPRWFDFSSAPDVPGFNSSSCSADITWGGRDAFHMPQLKDQDHELYNPGLRGCISKAPRLVGCEAAYYFPKGMDMCSAAVAPAFTALAFGGDGDDGVGLHITDKEVQHGTEEEGAGNLVVHVRSGDIFDDAVLFSYGQPPLQFYLQVLQQAEWDRVDIVTYAPDEQSLNPVIPALKAKLAAGELPNTVHIHTNRTMETDLASMMCADALALARSSLPNLTAYHSKAKKIFVVNRCTDSFRRLVKHRPDAQVYGLVWPQGYTVYDNWQNTPKQRKEMLTYDKIHGFTQCTA